MSAPEPGWYPDPMQPGRLRWWDGEHWIDEFAPGSDSISTADLSGAGLRGVGDMLGDVFQTGVRRAGHILPLVILGALLPAFLWGWLVFPVVARLSFVDSEWSPLADGDAGRLLGACALFVLAGLWLSLAVTHQVWQALEGSNPSWAASAIRGVVLLPRLLFWGFVALIPLVLGFVLLAVMASAGIGTSGLALVALGLGVLCLIYLVQLAFFTTAVVASPGSNPIAASVGAVKGQFWPIVGRILMLVLVGFTASFALGVIINPLINVLGAQLDIAAAADFDSDGLLRSFRGELLGTTSALFGVAMLLTSAGNAFSTVLMLAGMTSLYRSVPHGDSNETAS